ncbi:unnamed protein product [Cunninghamella blakesleeana]
MIVNLDDNAPATGDFIYRFKNLKIGTSGRGDVRFSDDNLFGMLFPHLYPDGDSFWRFSLRDKITIKEYAKMVLSHPYDRRFAKSPSFIFFVADYIEKQNIHSYRMRTIGARHRSNINMNNLFVSNEITNEKYIREDITSAIPHIVRSSYSYKRKRFLDLMAMFRCLGDPQIFITITCNDFSKDMLCTVQDDEPWTDPVRFANHFRHSFLELFNRNIKEVFGRRVGKIKDFFWVLELQARGSPHIHMLLWTGKTADELMDSDIVVATLPPVESELRDLVNRHQIHKCSSYCKPNGLNYCRFGFPFLPSEVTKFDNTRVIYKRNEESAYVNPYNPYLLSVGRCNMDIQINKGYKTLSYLCKYLTKFDTGNDFSIVDSSQNNMESSYVYHFRGRQLGIVEAVYDIFGWRKESSSREVIYLNTNLPSDQRYTIKKKEHLENSNLNDYTYKTQLQKYVARPNIPVCNNLTMPQFFTTYIQIYSLHNSGMVRGTDNSKWKKRKGEPCLWRTRYLVSTSGESFFYQRILLNVPFRDIKEVADIETYGSYKACHDQLVEEGKLSPIPILIDSTIVQNMFTVAIQNERGINNIDVHNIDIYMKYSNILQEMINSFTKSQYTSYSNTLEHIDKTEPVLIHGSAGTGKSYLLKAIEIQYQLLNFSVIKLALTGVAAHNIGGSTIHRFFGFDNVEGIPNHIRLDHFVKEYPQSLLLIDEISMISGELLNKMDKALQIACRKNTPFGNIPVVFFGDFAQILPFSKDSNDTVSLPMQSDIFKNICIEHVYHPCRQTNLQFYEFLNLIRMNKLDDPIVIENLKSRMLNNNQPHSDSIVITSYKEGARQFNYEKLDLIKSEKKKYLSIDEKGGMGSIADLALEETSLEKCLEIKIGARVMILHNYDIQNGWVNGTLCTVQELENDAIRVFDINNPNKKFIISRITRTVPMTGYSRSQFPISLAWALTIHKVQGLTLSRISLFISDFFAPGLLYVALTRVKNLDDITLILPDIKEKNMIKVPYNDICLSWLREFEKHVNSIKYQQIE